MANKPAWQTRIDQDIEKGKLLAKEAQVRQKTQSPDPHFSDFKCSVCQKPSVEAFYPHHFGGYRHWDAEDHTPTRIETKPGDLWQCKSCEDWFCRNHIKKCKRCSKKSCIKHIYKEICQTCAEKL